MTLTADILTKPPALALPDRTTERLALVAAGIFYAAGSFLPWGWPSVDGYPAIERFIDPGFLANDFYTSTTAHYNVDTLLAATLGGLQQATGVRYDGALAALNLVRCLVWPFVLFQFFRAFSGDRRLALVGALLGAASLYSVPNLFAWGWLWGDPSTAMFAVLLITGAWTFFLDRAPARAMALFSVALLVHPLMAVHGGLFAALIFVADYDRAEKMTALRSTAAWIAGLVFAGLFIAQYLLLGATPDTELSVETYTRILAYVRHPTDFIPTLFPLTDWISGLLSAAAALLIVWRYGTGLPRRRLFLAGLVSYAAICLCGYLFVELYPVRFFVELIPFRYVIVGAPLMLLAYGVFAASELRDGRFASFIVMAALFVIAAIASRGNFHWVAIGAITGCIAIRVLTGRPALAAADSFIAKHAQPNALVAAIAAVLFAASPAAVILRLDELVVPRVGNQHPLYAWAANETPTGAVFLIDQAGDAAFSRALDPQRMRLVGRRAVAASKDFPFLDRDISPWNERWEIALGGGAPRFVSKAGGDQLVSIAARVPFDYVVRDRQLDDPRFRSAKTFAPAKGAGAIYVYALGG